MALGTSIVNKSSKKLAPKKPAPRNKPAAESTPQVSAVVPEVEPRHEPAQAQAPVVDKPTGTESHIDDIQNDRPSKRRRVESILPVEVFPTEAPPNNVTEPQGVASNEARRSARDQAESVPSGTDAASNELTMGPSPASQSANETFLPTPTATQVEAPSQVVADRMSEVSSSAALDGTPTVDETVPSGRILTPGQDVVTGGLASPPQTQDEVPESEATAHDLRSDGQQPSNQDPTHADDRTRSDGERSLFLPSDDTMLEDAETLLALRTAHANGFANIRNQGSSPPARIGETQDELPDSEVHVVASTSRVKKTPKPRQPRKPKEPGEPKKPRQPRKKAASAATAEVEVENAGAALQKKPRKKRQPKSQATVQATEETDVVTNKIAGPSADVANTTEDAAPENDTAADIVDEIDSPESVGAEADEANETSTKRRGGRRRAETPEDAENQEIDPTEVSMFELTRDVQLGKISNREREMRKINWVEVAQRRKQAEEEAKARALAGEGNGGEDDDEERQRIADDDERRRENAGVSRGPQLRLVNGQMILDTESLVVTNRGNTDNREGGVAEEESDLTKRINSQSWLYDNRREPGERFASTFKSDPWTEDQTDAFYDALRMFGTDFFIISKMFPGKTRRHIKLKFVREERLDPDRVKSALIGEVVEMDMGVYCAATGMNESQFKDPVALEEELRVESEQQREQIEKERDEAADAAKKKQEAAQEKTKRAKKTRKKKGAEDVGGDPEVDLGEVAR